MLVTAALNMEYINRITLVGRAGQDPEIVYFESGAVKVSLSLAVRPPYKKKSKDKDKDGSLWFDVIAWGVTAEIIKDYVLKGTQLALIGEFGFDRWTDKRSGAMRSKPVITIQTVELVGSRNQNEEKSSTQYDHVTTIANANF